MLILVTFDLLDADPALFDAYEARVLPLLPRHGAALQARLRHPERLGETHLLRFPSPEALEAYRDDPDRRAAAPLLERSGARSLFREIPVP